MPFGSVTLVPGINVERTPTLLEAGYSQSQLIRFRDGLAQKIGGWTQFFLSTVSGVPRDLHAWADLNATNHLLVGTTAKLNVITNGSLQNITPQTLVSDFVENFSTIINTKVVTIVDTNIANLSVNDAVLFNTPVSIGGVILSGIYPITSIVGVNSYTINAPKNATATAAGGSVPIFTTTSSSTIVSVQLPNHGLSVGSTVVFRLPTTGSGVTISGAYTVNTVVDANNFTITVSSTASSSSSFPQGTGKANVTYYIALGPPPVGVGFGLGGFGLGGFGTGVVPPNQLGNEITATDYTSDNWGQIALACPENGGIYFWDPSGGFTNASLVASGPVFNRGIFVSTSQQILIAFGSTIDETINGGIGLQQDPMLVSWCDVGNFFQWQALTTTQAGNFRIPIGSMCVGGMAVSNQNLIWTDLDLWAMNYIGYPNTYGFNKIGAGAGLASSHAAMQLRGGVYWIGKSNFYSYTGNGVQVIPCPVWDFVFQNLNTAFIHNVRAMPNTPFNEVGWAFPTNASVSGECDAYVKMNITEPSRPWDYGFLPRSAWIDQTVLGPPIGAVAQGIIYQHETSPDAAGQPLVWSYTTGYFRIAEGELYAFVDRIQPDFKWGTNSGPQTAQIQMSFNVTNYSGDPPTVYGPYTVTQATEFITTRFRGGLMSITVSGSDLGSFSRLGYVRYRYSADGRR